jgi:hypothetical protein
VTLVPSCAPDPTAFVVTEAPIAAGPPAPVETLAETAGSPPGVVPSEAETPAVDPVPTDPTDADTAGTVAPADDAAA